ncbi:MFS transporter [Streptomyces ferrugineus]|uniref:MFS transporter n=1 Tax=Streptomyces ferrugineus TaxID=1413221 RepID=A0A7M2SM98_9ACTN|nr:MFS transporter [Streptomyces ferrugineus]QOV36593.1 MFS transporter [Streptomyces ferrugineus]
MRRPVRVFPKQLAPSAPADRSLGAPFRIFQASVLGSNLADGVYLVTLPLLALSLSGSALVVSAVGVAMRAPWLLLILPAGVVVDRCAPMAVMNWASKCRFPLVAVLGLLAWAGMLPVWALVAGAFLIAAMGTFVDLAAQSLLPRLVAPELLPRANANLQSGQTLAAQFAGPALGGVLASMHGVGFTVAAVLYAGGLIGLALLHRRPGVFRGHTLPAAPREPGPAGRGIASMWRDLREGAAYFRRRHDLIGLAAVAATGNIAFAATMTMLPVWVVSPGRLGLPSSAMGVIAAAPAVGGVLAGLVAARLLKRFGGRTVLGFCAPAVGLCVAAIALPTPPAAFAALAVCGGLMVQLNVMSMSHRQSTIPTALFARVNSVYRWIILGVSPVGALLGGLVAQRFGTAAVFLSAGALALAAGTVLPALLFHPSPQGPDRLAEPRPTDEELTHD